MRRRTLLKSTASAAAVAALPSRFAIADSSARTNKLLRYVPTADLSVLDPTFTTTQVSITHGYYVFDTLYGIDHTQTPRPQMAEGASVSDDGRTWDIRLREGLKFHDGEPVLARDAAASLKRWCARDVYGQAMGAFVDTFTTADDRTIRIKLKSPFPILLDAIAKPNGMLPAILPERLASIETSKQVTEMVGSGPYRFLKGEFVPGSRSAYERFKDYVPRQEKPSWASGGKVAHIERIEWTIINDPSTASAALQKGEIDWWEQVQPDLLPLLRKSRDLTVTNFNPVGFFGTMRFNHLHPPFNNVAVRRAVRLGMDQEQYMSAVTGNDPAIWKSCKALFPCGTTYGEDIGGAGMTGDVAAARKALKDAGYAGEKVVILNPADVPTISPFGQVTYEYLKTIGMNVELQDMDWNTLAQRRTKSDPPEKGGWSIFHNWWLGTSFINPAISPVLRGLGAKGWAGWYSNPGIEELVAQWTVAPTQEERVRLARVIHQVAMDDVPTVVLGRFFILSSHHRALTGLVESTSPYPWNLRWS
ncbi:MAG: ABC transporter substrate-binding protein [Acetobacteraceae bacterium]